MSTTETVGQIVESPVVIPSEPGLYWASIRIEGQYDSVLLIYGKAPFLKTKLVGLPVIDEYGIPIPEACYFKVLKVGPKFVIPGLDGKQSEPLK